MNKKLDGDFNYANFEFVVWVFWDRSRDFVQTPLLEQCGHKTPCVEAFSYLHSVLLPKNHH